MSGEKERALFERYEPLIQAELRRIGVSEADEQWIHAGSGGHLELNADMFEAHLTDLRALPTSLGVVGYCAYLGFDYENTKRELVERIPGTDNEPR